LPPQKNVERRMLEKAEEKLLETKNELKIMERKLSHWKGIKLRKENFHQHKKSLLSFYSHFYSSIFLKI
jgi:hypothetical protein